MVETTPVFPPEIIERILDILLFHPSPCQYHSGIDTLKSWSLVSRAWAPRAQKRIFSRINITISRYGTPYLEFFDNVVLHPERHGHLATYVASLRIHQSEYVEVRCQDSGRLGRQFPSFLKQLSVLQEIIISLPDDSWSTLSFPESLAFISAFRLPTLKEVRVNVRGGFPMSMLGFFGPSVRTLCIGQLGLMQVDRGLDNIPAYAPQPAKLRHLEVSMIAPLQLLSGLLTSGNIRGRSFEALESLRISVQPGDHEGIASIIRTFFERCPLLWLLGFTVGLPEGKTYPPIELQRSNEVAVRILLWFDVDVYCGGESATDWIITLIQCLPSFRNLQKIRFEYHFRNARDLKSWIRRHCYRSLQALDEYLYLRQPMLENVSLGICVPPTKGEARALAAHLTSWKYFNKLDSMGIFSGVDISSFESERGVEEF